MDCTITTTTKARRRGFTLIEMMIALGIAAALVAVISAMGMFSGRTFAAMTNYIDLDQKSRNALDVMSREVRQAGSVTNHTTIAVGGKTLTNSITMIGVEADGVTTYSVRYYYNPNPSDQKLYEIKVKGGVTTTRVLLEECTYLNFGLFTRVPKAGSDDAFDITVPNTTKLVQMTWVCQRNVLGTIFNTESVQSAKVVIRKE